MRFNVKIPGLYLFQGHAGQSPWVRDITTEDITRVARRADELGFDAIGVPWHVAIKRGEPERNFGPRWPHAIAAAGFLLGATDRIEVMPNLVVPCEPPLQTAKALATLDWMSGGRATPVLMTGYLEWEFEMLRVPYAERGPIMDEYVDAALELWRSEAPSFQGEYVSFEEIAFEPKPLRDPLPLWFGGRAKSALRRIARHGSGWLSYATPYAEMPATIEYIRNCPEFVADPRPLEVAAYFVEPSHDPISHARVSEHRQLVGTEAVIEQLGYLASIGVDRTFVPIETRPGPDGKPSPVDDLEDYVERLEWFAAELLPAARGLRSPFGI